MLYMDLVRLDNVKKTYAERGAPPVDALRGISLNLETGSTVSLMGVSGSGKTTLLNIIGCCDRPTSGKYFFCGEDVSLKNDRELCHIRNQQVGFITQNLNLLPYLSTRENIMLPALIGRKGSEDAKVSVGKMMAKLEISDKADTQIRFLSGGQKQRAAIARALINGPKLILADEPTAALDTKTAAQTLKYLFELQKELGFAIVLSTHDKNVANMCSIHFQIADGKITAEDKLK